MSGYNNYWAPYVTVAERREEAAKIVAKMKKNGKNVMPIVIEGRIIASTFWGKAWCKNLESYSDCDNRLPRGRTYVRNGSVIHLEIGAGEIKAMVNGSSMYEVNIAIDPVTKEKWEKIVDSCSGSIGSLVELLQGKFSKSVMAIMAEKDGGLFPAHDEIKVKCNCYDYAIMCKHVAAVMYGVGARLDSQPELLFTLRQADHFDLLDSASIVSNLDSNPTTDDMDTAGLSALFGIDIEDSANANKEPKSKSIKSKAKKKPVKSKTTKAKTATKQNKSKVVKSKSTTKNKTKKTSLKTKDTTLTSAIKKRVS